MAEKILGKSHEAGRPDRSVFLQKDEMVFILRFSRQKSNYGIKQNRFLGKCKAYEKKVLLTQLIRITINIQ